MNKDIIFIVYSMDQWYDYQREPFKKDFRWSFELPGKLFILADSFS